MDKSYTLVITNKFNYCTDVIVKWLKYYKHKFIIIDTNKKVQVTKIEINNIKREIELLIDGENINLNQIDSVVFWKGKIQFMLPPIQIGINNTNFKRETEIFLKRELDTIIQYIYDDLNKKKIFGLCITKNPNKLTILSLAKEVELKIPDTTISSLSKTIKNKVYDNVSITKSIQEIFNFYERDKVYATLTSLVDVDNIDRLDEIIFPSLVQENIDKKYELRIFYFNGKFYTMAIFSQYDEQTKTDFRNYNYDKPNRMVPYTLPNEVKMKLKKLIDKIGYMSCSTDMIVDREGEYVFLEVNPLGQFDLESLACNFNIEKKVVEYLIN
ncbi:MAG: grasp-with-spasm system ATP-grasp peptide maturase [Bacteroidales bacterium]